MNKINPAYFVSIIVLTIPFLITGCGSSQIKPSGFLRDYSALKPSENGSATLRYLKHSNVLNKYNKVIIDPIEIWFDPKAEYQGINPNELGLLTEYFQRAIVKSLESGRDSSGSRLKSGYPVVERPGQDVLRVRIAITGLKPEKPKHHLGVHTGATYVQMKLNESAARKITGIETTMEAELLDSQTNERVAAIVDRRTSSLDDLPFNPPTWEFAKQALDYWAGKLRQAMNNAH